MSVTLLVITDGRHRCIEQSIPSALEHLHGPIVHRLIYDDTGDNDHRRWLAARFGPLGFLVLHHPDGRQGFGGAIRTCWRLVGRAAAFADSGFVFHLEDDFTFNRDVDLDAMIDVLDGHPDLVQLALRRQPVNDAERAAGGVVEQWPDEYVDVSLDGLDWLQHRLFFTTNPSLYRRSLCERGWPEGEGSEAEFTRQVIGDPAARFAFWGERTDEPWVTHIGRERAGHGY